MLSNELKKLKKTLRINAEITLKTLSMIKIRIKTKNHIFFFFYHLSNLQYLTKIIIYLLKFYSEVKRTVFSINPNKASGLDGFIVMMPKLKRRRS